MEQASFYQIQAFVQVVEHQSFAKAALALKMTPSSVSRLVKALEQHLGVLLIQRTTRAMALTASGQHYFNECAPAFEQLRAAADKVRERQSIPRGTLKLSVPVSFGRTHVLPFLASFLDTYPELELDLLMSDQYVDLISEGVSVAIRIGHLNDSSLVARKMMDNHRILVAAPGYLLRHGRPQHIGDLQQHSCLSLALNRDGEQWRIRGPDGERSLRPRGRIRADNGDAIRQLAIDGLGIAFLSSVTVTGAIQAGELVQLLPEWKGRDTGVYGICPARPMPTAPRLLIDFLMTHWQAMQDGK